MEQDLFRTSGGPRVLALLNPATMARNLWRQRHLAMQLARRDIAGRYKAAQLGLFWSILTPLVLLVIYTFVFTVVFQSKWGDNPNESKGHFALTMFCGMLVFNLFAEVVNRAPTMVVYNPNYVKKVVFPLEVFIISGLLSALINMAIGYGVWLVGWAVVEASPPHWTMVWFPLVLVPVCLMTAGVSWVLASLGVFIRDVGHAVLLITQVLFFATPVFYSLDRVPPAFQRVMAINPLTHAIEDVRRALIWGAAPDWKWWGFSVVVSAVLAVLGYAFFMKSKRAFADVI